MPRSARRHAATQNDRARSRGKVACEVAMAYIKGQQEVQHSAKIGIEGGEFNRWYNVVKREHDDNLEQMVRPAAHVTVILTM